LPQQNEVSLSATFKMIRPIDKLSFTDRSKIGVIIDEFVAALGVGREPTIRDWVLRVASPFRRALREELVGELFEHRYGHLSRYRVDALYWFSGKWTQSGCG